MTQGPGNNRVRLLAANGRSYTLAGSNTAGAADGTGSAASFTSPADLLLLPGGELLIAGNEDRRLRKLQPVLKSCDDANSCTADACAPKIGCVHVPVAEASACTDGDFCTPGDACANGKCKPGKPTANCACKPGPTGGCDDANPCTSDGCHPVTGCTAAGLGDGTICNDGDPCTSDEQWLAGNCAPNESDWIVEQYAGSELATGGAAGKRDGWRRQTNSAGSSALFNPPSGIDIDAAGNLYVVDYANHLLRRIGTDGIVTTLAGSPKDGYGFVDGQGPAAQLSYPEDVCVDAAANAYIADSDNHRIRTIAPDGSVTTLAGSTPGYVEGKAAAAKFDNPRGVALGSDGALYVADSSNHRVRKVTTDGTVSTFAGSSVGFLDAQGTLAKFSSPTGVAFDSSGNLFVADSANHRIRKIVANGTVSTMAGTATYGASDGPTSIAKFYYPSGVDVDAKGNIWVADSANALVRRIDPNGYVLTVTGFEPGFGNGRGRMAGRFNNVHDVAVAPDGSVFVADRDNHAIRRVWPDGTTTTVAGNGIAGYADGMGGDARFLKPEGIALDKAGQLWVSDGGNNRIRKISLALSTCTALSGASKANAGKSCKVLQAIAKWSGPTTYWVDPNGGSKDDAIKTTCDMATEGGGWTRVDSTISNNNLNLLLEGKGRQMLKCSDTATDAIVSPVATAPWGWTTKAKLVGDWTVAGKTVSCGGDASFDAISCGWGYGCSSGPKDPAQLYPGVQNATQCANDKTAQVGTAFAMCAGNLNYTEWKVFVRSEN